MTKKRAGSKLDADGSHSDTRITKITVERLYGYLNYRLPGRNRKANSLAILYGENGTGKTTILNLIFSLLCSERVPGIKSFLGKTPFQLLRIELNNGITIAAERKKGVLEGDFVFSIGAKGVEKERFNIVTREDGVVVVENNPEFYDMLSVLDELQFPITYLPDARSVYFSIPTSLLKEANYLRPLRHDADEVARQSYQRYESHSRYFQGNRHHLALSPIIRAVEFWMNKSVIAGTASGTKSVNDLYMDMLKSMASITGQRKTVTRKSFDERQKRLHDLAYRATGFQKYSLAPTIEEKTLKALISKVTAVNRAGIAPVLDAYLDSTQTRMDALEGTRSRIDTLSSIINSLFSNKSFHIDARNGIRIVGPGDQEIDPEDLSSGERQLLSILMHTLLAGEMGGIFLIDEPELSLNIRWQRRLLDSISEFPSSEELQVILASHSMEILTKYRETVIEL